MLFLDLVRHIETTPLPVKGFKIQTYTFVFRASQSRELRVVIVSHLLRYRTSVFAVSSEETPELVVS
jgi:hypothetical protein